jgi:hypothetical protein
MTGTAGYGGKSQAIAHRGYSAGPGVSRLNKSNNGGGDIEFTDASDSERGRERDGNG